MLGAFVGIRIEKFVTNTNVDTESKTILPSSTVFQTSNMRIPKHIAVIMDGSRRFGKLIPCRYRVIII